MSDYLNTPPDVGQCLQRGWDLYRRAPLLLSGVTVLAAALNAIAGTIPFATLLVYGPLLGGLYLLIIRLERGEPVGIAQYFDAFKLFLPLLLVTLLTSLFVSIGLLLLVLPGIFVALIYSLSTLNVVDRGLDFWPAMERSRKMIMANFWAYLVLALVSLVVILVSAIPFGLGLLISVPVALGAQYTFYLGLEGRLEGEAAPPTPEGDTSYSEAAAPAPAAEPTAEPPAGPEHDRGA